MGQTVNLLAYAFGGSNPSLPTGRIGNGSPFFVSTLFAITDATDTFASSIHLTLNAKKHEMQKQGELRETQLSDLSSFSYLLKALVGYSTLILKY